MMPQKRIWMCDIRFKPLSFMQQNHDLLPTTTDSAPEGYLHPPKNLRAPKNLYGKHSPSVHTCQACFIVLITSDSSILPHRVCPLSLTDKIYESVTYSRIRLTQLQDHGCVFLGGVVQWIKLPQRTSPDIASIPNWNCSSSDKSGGSNTLSRTTLFP